MEYSTHNLGANDELTKSALGNVIYYSLKSWDALRCYAEYGFLHVNNNVAELLLCVQAVIEPKLNLLLLLLAHQIFKVCKRV